MKAKFLIITAILVSASFTKSVAESGGDIFKRICAACHSIGKGKVVGPDLKGVETRHTDEWMMIWVKSSQTMVNAGDAEAVKVFTENNKIPMPDQPTLSDDDIKSVLAYIKETGKQAATASTAAVTNPNGGPDNITVAAQKAAEEERNSGSLLTMFSFTEYLLMFLMGILLIIIYVLSMSVKTLTEKIREKEVQ